MTTTAARSIISEIIDRVAVVVIHLMTCTDSPIHKL